MGENLNLDILACKNINVILKVRESELPYTESYRFNNIVFSEGRFWGKFANVHSPIGHEEVGSLDLLSYSYNNFSPVVCTHSLNNRMERFYSANAYSEISFVSNGNYRKIWSCGRNNSSDLLTEAMASGLSMKAKIESTDGYVYIVPVHTIVMYEDKSDFVIETEFDGYPEKLRHFKYIEAIASKLNGCIGGSFQAPYTHTGYEFNSAFFLTYFVIKRNQLKHVRIVDGGNLTSSVVDYKEIEIWSESS